MVKGKLFLWWYDTNQELIRLETFGVHQPDARYSEIHVEELVCLIMNPL